MMVRSNKQEWEDFEYKLDYSYTTIEEMKQEVRKEIVKQKGIGVILYYKFDIAGAHMFRYYKEYITI